MKKLDESAAIFFEEGRYPPPYKPPEELKELDATLPECVTEVSQWGVNLPRGISLRDAFKLMHRHEVHS